MGAARPSYGTISGWPGAYKCRRFIRDKVYLSRGKMNSSKWGADKLVDRASQWAHYGNLLLILRQRNPET